MHGVYAMQGLPAAEVSFMVGGGVIEEAITDFQANYSPLAYLQVSHHQINAQYNQVFNMTLYTACTSGLELSFHRARSSHHALLAYIACLLR